MALFIGNPTNIIVGEAYSIGFLEYSAWMILPTIAAGVTTIVSLYVLFFKDIAPQIHTEIDLDENTFLKDKKGAIFGGVCMGTCLVVLMCSSLIPIPLWTICVIFAGLMLMKDIHNDYHLLLKVPGSEVYEMEEEFETRGRSRRSLTTSMSEDSLYEEHIPIRTISAQNSILNRLSTTSTWAVIARLPWKILPFVFCIFIIVYDLQVFGWTHEIAKLLASVISSAQTPETEIITATFLIGSLSTFMCNVLNNQPMTILFTGILRDYSLSSFSIHTTRGMLFSLIIGSNLGANFTLIGALAGIMWNALLEQRNLSVSYLQFLKYGCLVMTQVVVVTLATLSLELIVHRHFF
eukprot:TRINITY_DN3858_c0_g1_i3.p1 TRINITY_DN3858_c0_g1~~TRINITY_DN3858_c0_g1_i3.p1  ORF type:complete len:350 (+),score=14.99 TRINITY_DN3858_c0_g1_i3:346-1395(+)